MNRLPFCVVVALAVCGCNDATRSITKTAPASSRSNAVVERDNTAVNDRDREDAAKTPFDQSEKQSDINITAHIRKQVVDTKMSVNAQNVKIISQDGRVTLRGPVKSEEEKKRIEEIAHSVTGADKVDSQLEVEQQP